MVSLFLMEDSTTKNKRIAKNTIMMYIRMFVIMAISLFTSRVVLNALGVTDYGIYNEVGGIVTFLAFINAAMMAATQRFLNYEMGRGNEKELSIVFKTSYVIHIFLAIVIVIIGCIIGKYLINYKIQIPPERISAATVVLYASCAICGLQILTLPFSSAVIAHERLNIYATISIIESFARLGIAYLIDNSTADKLEEYAILMASLQIFNFIVYLAYCRRNFKEVRGNLVFKKERLKSMGNFALWCVIGCMAGTFANQGISILLGVFFLPAINAAIGIASQVQGAVSAFGSNLNTAMAPQITQSYASGDMSFFFNIIYRGSKYVFILMSAIAIPILLRTDYIVNLWLGEVPEYTIIFIKWLLCSAIVETVSYPLMRASDASGKIKIYHSVVGGILLMILPVSYVLLKLTGDPVAVFEAYFLIDLIAWAARLLILRTTVKLSMKKYFKEVLIRIILIFALSLALSYLTTFAIPHNFSGLIISTIIAIVMTLVISYVIGFDKQEKIFLNSNFLQLMHKI